MSNKWSKLIKIRDISNISIEQKRANKIIGSSLEASLLIRLGKENFKLVQGVDLAELCITSRVDIVESETDSISVETKKAQGKKCPVCWKISKEPCPRHSL